jgi:two-component system chemotaxis response regulator CheB
VLTLDVEMPRMDGVTFLEKLMRRHPLPVVMVSSLTEAGCATTLRALELGAVDFVTKPSVGLRETFPDLALELTEKVKVAAVARLRRPCPTPIIRPLASLRTMPSARRLVAVGASTGGTEALRELLTALPADAPPMLVVQHMPEQFTRAFANRLNDLSAVQVREAADGDRVLDGCVLVAPGNRHMRLARDGATLLVRLSDDPPVNRHRPSVDVLFESCADVVGASGVGVIMTAWATTAPAGSSPCDRPAPRRSPRTRPAASSSGCRRARSSSARRPRSSRSTGWPRPSWPRRTEAPAARPRRLA